jgi:hypothetical protein
MFLRRVRTHGRNSFGFKMVLKCLQIEALLRDLVDMLVGTSPLFLLDRAFVSAE